MTVIDFEPPLFEVSYSKQIKFSDEKREALVRAIGLSPRKLSEYEKIRQQKINSSALSVNKESAGFPPILNTK